MPVLAAVDVSALVAVATAIGAGIGAYKAGRSAKKAAGEAKDEATAAKDEASAAKVATIDTKQTVETVAQNVAQSLDQGTVAGLLSEATTMLQQSAAQLARCEGENRQYQAIVRNLEKKVNTLEAKVAGFEAAFALMKDKGQ